jgi:hypothetical protein
LPAPGKKEDREEAHIQRLREKIERLKVHYYGIIKFYIFSRHEEFNRKKNVDF